MIAHYFSMLLVFFGSMAVAWGLLDWVGAFPEDEG
jgi:hypothetical protein